MNLDDGDIWNIACNIDSSSDLSQMNTPIPSEPPNILQTYFISDDE